MEALGDPRTRSTGLGLTRPAGAAGHVWAALLVVTAVIASWFGLAGVPSVPSGGLPGSYHFASEPIWGTPASLAGRALIADDTPVPSPTPGPASVIPAGRESVHVPILMYHYIRINPDPRDQLGFNLSVTPDDFRRQMDWLAANAYHPITLNDLRGYLLAHGTLPSRPVVLTFDDGYADFYSTAFPILRDHHFTAVSYVVSGFLGNSRYMTVQEVADLDTAGIEIGAHTVSHADLTRLRPFDLQHEVADSKITLESIVHHPVLDFCYPSGRFNAAVEQTVQGAGFESATTTQPGTVHSAGDRFAWTRVRVGGGESLPVFTKSLGLEEPPQPAPASTPVAPAPPPSPSPSPEPVATVGSLTPAPVPGIQDH